MFLKMLVVKLKCTSSSVKAINTYVEKTNLAQHPLLRKRETDKALSHRTCRVQLFQIQKQSCKRYFTKPQRILLKFVLKVQKTEHSGAVT